MSMVPLINRAVIENTPNILSNESLNSNIDILQIEQPNLFALLVCGGSINPNMFKGFILCYFMIRQALEAKEVKELEDMLK